MKGQGAWRRGSGMLDWQKLLFFVGTENAFSGAKRKTELRRGRWGTEREEPGGEGCVCMRGEKGEGGEVGMCVFCVAIVKVCCLFCGTA